MCSLYNQLGLLPGIIPTCSVGLIGMTDKEDTTACAA